MYYACQAKGSAAAPLESSVYCACHAQGKCGGSVYCACQAKGSRGPAAATAPQLLKKALCTARATQNESANALCTAPARQPRASGGHRAAAPLESSVYCACHAQGKCGGSVYCACQAAAGQRRPPRRSSSTKHVVRLPRKREVRRLCVLRLPGSRGPAAATAPQLFDKALYTTPATQKGSAEALCTAPARQKAAAGQRPPRRSSSRSSVYCACQAKGSRGPAAATAPQLLDKALCTAPATQKGSAEALCTAPACHAISGVVKSGE